MLTSIWYSFNGTEGAPFSAKLKRTFEIGHRLEAMMLDYIESAGFNLLRVRANTHDEDFTDQNKELDCQDSEIAIFQGHMDAILNLNEDHKIVLEIKTANDSEFNKFVKEKVQRWRPAYYAQVQSYMGMKEFKSALFIVLNKNTSDWHAEWVEYDPIAFHELRAKAQSISQATEPPPKINENPCYYVCNMCRFKQVCHS